MFRRTLLVVILCLFLHLDTSAGESAYDILYANIRPANLSESYDRIKLIPLKHFEFVHDSVPGRRHMGVIGPDAQKHFPESVEVVPTYTIPNKDRKLSSTILSNYPLVDKSVIFMHGLAAVQEIILLHESLEKSVSNLLESRENYKSMIAELNRRLSIEVDAQLVEKNLLAIFDLRLAEKELELDSLRATEEKDAIEGQLKEEKAMLQYEEDLARRRLDHQEQLATLSMEKILTLERDLAERREMLHRETTETLQTRKMEYSLKLEEKKKEFEMEKIKAEVLAKVEQERANEDITIRKMQRQAELDTKRYLDMIKSVSTQIALIAKDFFSDPERLGYTIAALLGLLLVYYALKEVIVITREFIKARLGRPSLVRETSVQSSLLGFLSPFNVINWLMGESLKKGRKKIVDHFQNVMLNEDNKARVIQLALATRNTRRTGTSFRHLLLHGPPGTGKTLIARRLAECSGMDYAIMSGGDVGPLGEDAVTQLHGLFRWASRSKRGLLVFIDEAEAFLSARGKVALTGADDTHVRHALNALLYQTGTQSNSFMMVLATNRPEDLDPAVLDRIDVSLYIGLPEVPERRSLVRLYLESNLMDMAVMTQRKWWPLTRRYYVDPGCNSVESIDDVAVQCEGFSGREISKLFISCHYAMIMAEKGRFTLELFHTVVANKISEHLQKRGFSGLHNNNNNNNNNNNLDRRLFPDTAGKMSRIISGSAATEKDTNSSESDYEVLSEVAPALAGRKTGRGRRTQQ